MSDLKLSIITVCYNSSQTIRNTIESVLNQTYTNIEYLLVDGGSNDETLEIIQSYEQDFKVRKTKYSWLSEPDNGLYDAMNKGIQIVNGDWIGIINSDDFFFQTMS